MRNCAFVDSNTGLDPLLRRIIPPSDPKSEKIIFVKIVVMNEIKKLNSMACKGNYIFAIPVPKCKT